MFKNNRSHVIVHKGAEDDVHTFACQQEYSRVRNKRSPTIINFLTFFQGLRPYSGLHSVR